MKDKIKAIFFDVDGTLYSHRIHDLLTSAKKTLLKLKENGYQIGISTSRCRYETKNLPLFFREFPFDAAFYDGGALVMQQEKVLKKSPIPLSAMEKLLHLAKIENMPLRYATMHGDYFAYPCDANIKDNFFKLYLNMPVLKMYEGEEVFNMLAYPNTRKQIEAIKELQDEISIITHGGNTLEITAHHINKSEGIKVMAEHWGIALEEIACFGDGYNDIEMLKNAGLGIAMGNAKEEVKQAADLVCDGIDHDGIYKICKELEFIS